MDDVNSLIALLREEEKESKAERKSNDCLDWMAAHWKLFARARRQLDTALKQCGDQFAYTPDGLAEALGLDARLHFAKISFNDIPAQLAKFQQSKMLSTFMEHAAKDGECVLLVIAGDRTCAVTNMQTHFVTGMMHMFLKSNGTANDIHVINWRDLPQRLPQIFDHTGDNNE